MKVLYWNIREVDSDSPRNALANNYRKFRSDFVCIAEPFVDIINVPTNYWRSLGLSHVASNSRHSKLPNIWLFASNSFADIKVIDVDAQQLSIEFSANNSLRRITFASASVFYRVRRSLWEKIIQNKNSWNGPFMAVGDFNAVLGAFEKLGNPPLQISCNEFSSFIDSCGFIDISTQGYFSTWINGCGTRSHVEQRLDRCLCTQEWLDAWDAFTVTTLTRDVSDHSPLLINAAYAVPRGRIPFCFSSAWCHSDQFIPLVTEVWKS